MVSVVGPERKESVSSTSKGQDVSVTTTDWFKLTLN